MNKTELLRIEDFLKDCRIKQGLAKKTIKAYGIDVRQFTEVTGGIGVDNKDVVQTYLDYLNSSYSKSATIKRKIVSVRSFYTYLKNQQIVESNYFESIKIKIHTTKQLPKVIEQDALDSIFSKIYYDLENANTEVSKKRNIRNIAILELLISTGLRVSELCELKTCNLDISSGKLKVLGKGAKERMIAITNEQVKTALVNYCISCEDELRKREYLFVNRDGGALSDQVVRLLLKELSKELNLSSLITPHMFRHTFATQLLENNVDIRYIQQMLGHSSISITEIYTHVSMKKQTEILEQNNPRNNIVLNTFAFT